MEFDFDKYPEPGKCGRLTTKKEPCVLPTELFAPGCTWHATEEELRMARLLLRAWRGGLRLGRKQNRTDDLEKQIEDLKREVRMLQRSDIIYFDDADQVVEINDGRAYRWRGQPDLELGERVIAPSNVWSRRRGHHDTWVGTVTRIGTWKVGRYPQLISRTGDKA